MDDMNINEIHLEEVEGNAEGDNWIRLNWNKNKSMNNDKESQATEKEPDIETLEETKDKNVKKRCNTETEDDGISVISDSDEDKNDASQQSQVRLISYSNLFQELPRLGWLYRPNNTKAYNVGEIIKIAFIVGIACGYGLCYILHVAMSADTRYADAIVTVKNASSDIADLTERLNNATGNILNTSKQLEEVKAMLNKIETRMPDNEKLLSQLSQLTDFSNQTNRKFGFETADTYFNEKTRPLNDLRISLYILSLLALVHDNNNSLGNEIIETLNIMNDTRTFYEALDTQDIHNSTVLKFLQNDGDKMVMTSESFLSDIKTVMNKLILYTNKKSIKMKNKLNKRLCHLKNQYPDDEGLKLTENNQLFDDKYCLVRKHSQKRDEAATKDDTKYKYKNQEEKHYDQRGNSLKKNLKFFFTFLCVIVVWFSVIALIFFFIILLVEMTCIGIIFTYTVGIIFIIFIIFLQKSFGVIA